MGGSSPPSSPTGTEPRARSIEAHAAPAAPDPSSETAPREGGRIPLARRHDDPQRIEGAGRWSVDATRRRCSQCGEALLDHEPFHTILAPASPRPTGSADAEGEDLHLFERRDSCEACFAASPPATAFAHWRAVLPPPPGGVRKRVNLASLLAHFHALIEGTRNGDAGSDDALAGTRALSCAGDEPALAGGEGATIAPESAGEPRHRLAYLLALFLVRRRMLRWEGVEEGILRLRCRESDRTVEIPVPDLAPGEIEDAAAQFEELFG